MTRLTAARLTGACMASWGGHLPALARRFGKAVDVGLQGICVGLYHRLGALLRSSNGCIHFGLDVGGRDDHEAAVALVEQLSEFLQIGPFHASRDVAGEGTGGGTDGAAGDQGGTYSNGRKQRYQGANRESNRQSIAGAVTSGFFDPFDNRHLPIGAAGLALRRRMCR